MKTGRLISEPRKDKDDDSGITTRSVRVLLPNGRKATAFIHNEPGEWPFYKKGQRIRLSFNHNGEGAAGINVVGKFGDDFDPVGEGNKEFHGPADGNLVLRSRNTLDAEAAGDARLQGDTVLLGAGNSGDQTALAIHEQVRTDLDTTHGLFDGTGSAMGVLLEAIKLAILAGGGSDITVAIEAFQAAVLAAAPVSEGAENVTAKPGSS